MPESKVQRRLAGLALHQPEKVFKRNKGILKMPKKELRKIAESSEKGLPKRKHRREGVLA